MPPPAPPSRDERAYTALFLLSLALRPVPESFPTSAIRVDRADLWRIAENAGAPLGRNRFHAATAALAEDEDQDGWSDLLIVTREPGNRRVVVTLRPDGDPDGWEEALDSFGLALDSATEAA